MKKWLNIFLSFILIISSIGTNFAIAAVTDSDGTELNPYPIYNYDDFININDNPSKHYKLMNDIVLEDNTFIPQFSGGLDGQNHSITINNIVTTKNYDNIGGLFVCISNATIKNLVIKGQIKNTSQDTSVGGVAGVNINTSYLINIKSFIDIYNECQSNNTGTGSMIGIADKSTLIIDNCENYGDIEGYNYYVGGIIGRSYGGNGSLILKNCKNFGNIKSNSLYCAGIAGLTCANSTISYCANYGNIIGSRRAAGIIGRVCKKTNISETFNVGKIQSKTDYAAGIVSQSTSDNTLIIESCYNGGNIIAPNTTAGIIHIITNNEKISIYDSYNSGTLEGKYIFNICKKEFLSNFANLFGLQKYVYPIENFETPLTESNIGELFINNSKFIYDKDLSDYLILANNIPLKVSYYKSIMYRDQNGIEIKNLNSNINKIFIDIKINSTETNKNIIIFICKFDLNNNLLEVKTSSNTDISIEDINLISRIEVFTFIGNEITPIDNSFYNCKTILN